MNFTNQVGNVFHTLRNALYNIRHPSTEVMAEEWDSLILFDACRYDIFSQEVTYKGKLESRISSANWSWPFMRENFAGRDLHDTVYVTANPHAHRLDNEVFHRIISVLDCWDEEYGTVLPEDVTKTAMEAHQAHPNKRIIIHYMQPHTPYLGKTADKLREMFDLAGLEGTRSTSSSNGTGESIFKFVKQGAISESDVVTAYRETLRIVMDAVKPLINAVDGRIVISADHGELLGDRVFLKGKDWGHSTVVRTDPLCRVPWFIVEHEGDTRRKISSDPPTTTTADHIKDDTITQRLEALGYR